ncbi:MAG TPA: SpoIIE family protein phosphatase [Candidatus Deferrimicrobium sp.]|nr:SpoIIE family protein phosphatase [Candidatus Deferrimicrobium sp.]
MFRHPIKEVNAEFVADDKCLESIRRTVRENCVAAGVSRKDVAAILLAMEEGATNIIRHAYLYEKGVIRLRIVVYRKLIVFSLIDSGRSFQPDGSGRIDLERLVELGRKGGLGFYMIQKIMDSVEYIAAAEFNELRMIKHIRPARGEGRPFLRRLMTLRVKFSLWTFFIVAVIISAAYYYVDNRTTRHLYGHLDDTVRALTKTIADQAAGYAINRRSDVEFDELIVSYVRSNPELELIVLTDTDGVIVAHSADIRNIRKPYEYPPEVRGARIDLPHQYSSEGQTLNYLMMPIRSGQVSLGLVHVVYSSAQMQERIAEARWRIAIFTFVLFVFGIVGIYFLSNYFVEPIVKITRRVRRFASGDLETELPLEGAEEFFEISRAFNEIMTRLSRDRKNIVAREKMAREIEVASQIQKTLLPRRLPEVPGMELDAFYRAAAIVGGDLYDVFDIGAGRFCLAVADVSGKGVPASLVMSMLRTVIQIDGLGATSARETLLKVNAYLHKNIPPGMFITVLLAIYDSNEQALRVVSAGHTPMLLYQAATGEVRAVNPAGMPLGMPSTLGPSFEQRLDELCLNLHEGDTILLFTDGITEAASREGQQYGLERLLKLFGDEMTRNRAAEISSVSKAIVSELDDFSGVVRPTDDLTFVIARIRRADEEGPGQRQEQADDSAELYTSGETPEPPTRSI